MAHTVTFKLNKPAQQFQAGDSTGFGIRGGVKYYDRKTKSDQWTNYQAVIFAKTQGQIDYYTASLIEGAVVTVSGDSLAVEQFQGQNGLQITLSINNARAEYICQSASSRAPDAAQQAYNQAIQQPQRHAQQAPQKPPAGFSNQWPDDDINF